LRVFLCCFVVFGGRALFLRGFVLIVVWNVLE